MKALLSGATETGAGSLWKLSNSTDIHTVQVVFTGTITALTVALEGSIDEDNIAVLQTHALSDAEISAKAAMFHVVNKLVEYVRINITTFTGSGSVTVSHSPAKSDALQI